MRRGVDAAQHVDLIGHQLHRQRARDMRGDVGLQDQRFAKRSVVGLGPEMHFGARLDQLRRDADAIAVAAHAAFEQIVDAKLAADLAGAFRRSLEQHRRRARDDAEPARAQPADLRDHFFGQAVAEIFLRRIAAQIRERQHDEPDVDAVAPALREAAARRAGCAPAALALDGRNEPVPAPVQRLDKSRIVRVVAERGAQALDRRIQAVLEIDEGPGGPQTLAQLFARHHLARPFEHHREYLKRLILKPDADAALPQLARAQIDFEGPNRLTFDGRCSSGSIGTRSLPALRRVRTISPKCERRITLAVQQISASPTFLLRVTSPCIEARVR